MINISHPYALNFTNSTQKFSIIIFISGIYCSKRLYHINTGYYFSLLILKASLLICIYNLKKECFAQSDKCFSLTPMIVQPTNRRPIHLAHAPVETFIRAMLFLLFTADLVMGRYTIFKKIAFKKLVLITKS